MVTEEQRQQIINQHFNQPKTPPEIKDIADKIEVYHQENYQACYPAGFINDWVYRAVLEKIVQPMQVEIDKLKSK